ncbi:hypothetical protein BDI4_1540002 [Burkholderia diffusa]|nr:hypothetical protein BDI4_1540002 [Burkholderia diffusa]
MDVDSDATELSVELRPVDSELIPVEVDVDSDATELSVELSPVDSDAIRLLDDDIVVDNESTAELVAKSCEPLIASVLVAEIWPAATLVI